MAALNIAFEAPENSGGRCPSQNRPIDLVRLAKQTKGDKALEMEVLQMFARQARGCLQAFGNPASTEAREAIAGRLKNAANAVGAYAVAAAATEVEVRGNEPAAIAAVAAAVVEAENFICKLCR